MTTEFLIINAVEKVNKFTKLKPCRFLNAPLNECLLLSLIICSDGIEGSSYHKSLPSVIYARHHEKKNLLAYKKS